MRKIKVLAGVLIGVSMLGATAARAQGSAMTWCAATVSGMPGPEKTYYSPLFPTPDDNATLDAQFKQFVSTKFASDPHASVASQCQGQADAKTAAGVRKANEASDGRLSTVLELPWQPAKP